MKINIKTFVLTMIIIVALKIYSGFLFYFGRAIFIHNVFFINYFNNININNSVVVLVYVRHVVLI